MTINTLPVEVDSPAVQTRPSGDGPPTVNVALFEQGQAFWSVLAARSRAMLRVAEDLLPRAAACHHATQLPTAPPERGRGDRRSDAPPETSPMAPGLLCCLPASCDAQIVAAGSPADVLVSATATEAVQAVSGTVNTDGVVEVGAVAANAEAPSVTRPTGLLGQGPGEAWASLGAWPSDTGQEAATVAAPAQVQLDEGTQAEPESFAVLNTTAAPGEASSRQDQVVTPDSVARHADSPPNPLAFNEDVGDVSSPAEAIRSALPRAEIQTTLAPKGSPAGANSEATSRTPASREPGQTARVASSAEGTKTDSHSAWTKGTPKLAGGVSGNPEPELGHSDEWAVIGQRRRPVHSSSNPRPQPPVSDSAQSVVRKGTPAGTSGSAGGVLPETMVSRVPPIGGDGTSEAEAAVSGIDFEDLLPQIVRHAQMLDVDGRTEVRIQLEPPSLGRLTLHVSADHNTVSIHLRADTAEARDLVQANVARLEAALQEQGIKIDRLMVHLGPALFRFGDDGRAEQQASNGFVRRSRAIGVKEGEREEWDQESILTYWQNLKQHLVDYLA